MTAPEPLDVGPIAGGHLRVGDADRDEAVALLDQARDAGRITPTEHEQRVALARQAIVFDDLFPLTRDLQGPRPSLTSNAGTGQLEVQRVERGLLRYQGVPGRAEDGSWSVAVFGSFENAPRVLNAKTKSITILGRGELDLTQTNFAEEVCVLDVCCLYGGLTVYVPEDVHVVNKTLAVFGSTEIKKKARSWAPDGPTLVLRGPVFCGGVEVCRR